MGVNKKSSVFAYPLPTTCHVEQQFFPYAGDRGLPHGRCNQPLRTPSDLWIFASSSAVGLSVCQPVSLSRIVHRFFEVCYLMFPSSSAEKTALKMKLPPDLWGELKGGQIL